MPRRPKLDIESLNEHNKSRVLGVRTCKACGSIKPALDFQPRELCVAKRGSSYISFRSKCKACRTLANEIDWASKRKEQYYDRTPERISRVVGLAARGYPNEEIAKIIRCDRRSLTKYFKKELKLGRKRFASWQRAVAERLELASEGRGRKYERTPGRISEVTFLASRGYSNRQIAKIIKCHPLTLGKNFESELTAGRQKLSTWRQAA